jgi:hypothetical protein
VGDAFRPGGGKILQRILIHEMEGFEIPTVPVQIFINDPGTLIKI